MIQRTILRGVDFGPAWIGSGAMGFFGEGYKFHPLYRRLFGSRFCPEGFTFVAKTTTIESRLGSKLGEEGNMELKDDFTPKNWFPDCITADVFKGEMLNAVGLSGPGAENLFLCYEWSDRSEPFFLSFMTTKKGEEARKDMLQYKGMLMSFLSSFSTSVGLQINLSCPNAGVHLEEAARDARTALDIFASLEIPLVPKFNVLTPVEIVRMVAEHPACDAIHVSNTIPYGKHEKINWEGGGNSPLAKYGGGGLSGAQLLPLVCDWVKEARRAGITKPINAGGGILSSKDVDRVAQSGADGVSIATAVALRPWRLRSILERAHTVFTTQGDK